MEFSKLMAAVHPAIIHFPIALLFTAVALDLYAYLRKDDRAAWAGQVLLVLGTVGTMFSFVTGSMAEIWAARSYWPQAPMDEHEGLATLTSWMFIAIVALRSFANPSRDRGLFRLYLLAAGLGLVALTATGYLGGELVYKYATGVQGVKAPFPATAQDLAVLSQTNSADELYYSELMHHIFGVMVLALALWLGYQDLGLPHVDRIRALGPVAMLAGGIFLMIFSDFDSWPLSDIKPVYDREVLAHKVIATMMILVGLGGSFIRKRSGEGGTISRVQNHLIAVLALAGGGILFTHVHTTAPYGEAAMGVYFHHMSLGTLALLCGAVKMLDLAHPEGHKLWNRAWIVLLFLIGFSLLAYNEGLPWYFGGPQG